MFESNPRSAETDALFAAILSLKTPEECYRFFDDLCTIGELKAMSQRLEVARLLSEKKTVSQICELTGASSATVTRVNRALCYGSDGYRLIFERKSNE